jgi:hypothetical protein
MNVTLALDDELVARAREVARRQGTTLNDVIRRHLVAITGAQSPEQTIAELRTSWSSHEGHSRGVKFSRDELYGERLDGRRR